MQQAGDLLIPENDAFFHRVFSRTGDKFDYESLEQALRFVADFTQAVDGGAHVGSWTRSLAERFGHVIALEPEPGNFECLIGNTKHLGNVLTVNAGLGEKYESVGLAPGPASDPNRNSGQWHVSGEGRIPIVPLDSFNLPALGFLKLDIEGYEYHALKGAAETITRCSPVVLIEDNGLARRYQSGSAGEFLESMGYAVCARINKDIVYKRR